MTPFARAGNGRRVLRHMVLGATLACVACGDASDGPPAAEFIVAAGDSTFWVRSEPGQAVIRVRGTPMVLARLDDRFRELYVVDDDRSFEDALFIGQRLYQRDILSGDSTEIFRDTLVPAMAARYERNNPEARRLGPDEEAGEEPSSTATAEVSVIGVHGPFLSLEYHADTAGAGNDAWHMTRHIVVDLRTGKPASLVDVLGAEQASAALARGRALYQETLDSVRRDPRPAARRAIQALGKFRFDPTSFSLAAPNGTLMVAFSAPGQGHGGEGFVLPMRPVAITEPAWWAQARDNLPSSTALREERWRRPSYEVRALYDTTSDAAHLVLVDSAGRTFDVGDVSAPVHRIYWLDQPAIDRAQRAALTRAFDEAAAYGDETRTAAGALQRPALRLAAARP